MVAELRKAFAQAKLNNNDAKAAGKKEDGVHKIMSLPRNVKSKLPLVMKLREKDAKFQPGNWLMNHDIFGAGKYPKGFEELVEKVENQTDGFRWSSWKQDGE